MHATKWTLVPTLTTPRKPSLLFLSIKNMVISLHRPYLPLAIMRMNLPVNEIVLVFSYTKVQISCIKLKRKALRTSSSQKFKPHNFVPGCDLSALFYTHLLLPIISILFFLIVLVIHFLMLPCHASLFKSSS